MQKYVDMQGSTAEEGIRARLYCTELSQPNEFEKPQSHPVVVVEEPMTSTHSSAETTQELVVAQEMYPQQATVISELTWLDSGYG